jgi:hypothetical protein
MKSTWEQKSKQSADYEKERLRLIEEQQNAEKLIIQQKEANWKLLENKNDIDLTMNFMKDSFRFIQSSTITWHEVISLWQNDLREVLKIESLLAEQDTVVQIYQNSVKKETDRLFNKVCKCVGRI